MKPPILSIEQSRTLDQQTIEEYGFPSILLMENAGRGLANVVKQALDRFPRNTEILIFCGSGNNGGDGFVAARHLFVQRYPVMIYYTKDLAHLTGDAKITAALAQKFNIPMRPVIEFLNTAKSHQNNPLLIVDALVGTGFKGDIISPIKEVIGKINNLKRFHNAKVTVISADIPSGVNGNTGFVSDVAIQADITVGFGSYKKGLLSVDSKAVIGKMEFVDIGIPEALISRIQGELGTALKSE